MKDILNFVKGAVSTKDLIPVLTNFRFYLDRVQGNNGHIAIDAPCSLNGVDITVPADKFLRALDACGGKEPVLKITESGRLSIRSGSFRSVLPLSNNDDFPLMSVENIEWEPAPPLLKTLRLLRPFVAEDASRPWSCGILFRENYAYATNNIIIARVPVPVENEINIPVFAVDELLRINEEPERWFTSEKYVSFTYANKGWMTSRLFDAKWPNISEFFENPAQTQSPIPEGLLDAVNTIRPFCPDVKFPVIHFGEEGVSTAEGDMHAAVEGFDLPEAKFRVEPLTSMLSVASKADFSCYPQPCPWSGPGGLEGLMVGVA